MFQYADRHYRCERYHAIGSTLKITGAFTGMNEGVVLRFSVQLARINKRSRVCSLAAPHFRIRPPRIEHYQVFLAPLQRIRFPYAIRRQSPLSDFMKGRGMLT